MEAQATADALNDLPVDAEGLRTVAIKLAGKAVLKLVSEHPDRLDQLASLTRLLLDSAGNEIRRSRLKLAQKCFDYEATVASQQELPHLRSYLKVVADEDRLSHEEKRERVHAILCGWQRSAGGSEPAKSSNGI